MNTIKFKEIDEHKIFDKFDKLPEDTAASMLKADDIVKELPEYKELEAKGRQKEEHHRKSIEAKGKAKLARIGLDDANLSEDKLLAKQLFEEVLKNDAEYKNRQGAAGVCNDELKEIGSRLTPKSLEVRRNNLAYSEPRLNEIVCSQEQIQQIVVALSEKTDNQQISLDVDNISEEDENIKFVLSGHSFVDDFRGCQYFFKDSEGIWVESEIITQLAADKNTVCVDEYQDQAIERGELTPEQLEEIRLQGMSDEDKAAEYEVKKTGLANQAATLENSLKFDGDPDYISKAQAWYDAELLKLKLIYGVA